MAAKSGLSFDVARFRKIMEQKKRRVSASSFRPQMEKFASRSLSRAAENCPTRDLALIRAAQSKQYDHRVNYIPSIHDDTADPRMIVYDDGSVFLYCGGKWYRPDLWKLPDSVLDAYLMLDAERNRRLETPKSDFIANRAQARFLYIQQFVLMARALGVAISAAGEATAAHARRPTPSVGPPKEPAKPNARWQGGRHTLSAVITAPFLSTETAYWLGNGLDILKDASDAERPKFIKDVQTEMIKRLTKDE